MLQPTGGPQPVAQPFSRSQLPRLAFFMVTLAGKCHSVLYAWTLSHPHFSPTPASGMHTRKSPLIVTLLAQRWQFLF